MSSASDSSSSDSEDEADLKEQIAVLEAALSKSPYYYDGHVQLIKLLRLQGNLDKSREARNTMRRIFPLTEDMWVEWVRDEMPLTGLYTESANEIRLLFESAVLDYLSVKVWLEFTEFAVDKMSLMREGLDFPRAVFERAVVACGLHVSQSGLIWDAYIGFEKALLSSLQEMQMTSDDAETKQQVVTQYERVDKLYKRRLAVTHIGMEEAFKEYRAFSDVVVTEEAMPAYAAAKKKLEEYLPFEEQLLTSDPPSLGNYQVYLDHLTTTKANPSLINTLYLRAVAHHCLDIGLWRQFLAFLEDNFKTAGGMLLPGYRMAVRNCPWEVDFWEGLARGMERNKSSYGEVAATYERSLGDNFTSPDDYLRLWTGYCAYLHRMNTSDPSQSMQNELLEVFTRASQKLKEGFGREGDPTDSLLRFRANIEQDLERGCFIWDDIMTRHGREAQYWLDYINYIRYRNGSLEKCRRLFQLAVNSASDDPQRVCEAFLQFEREVGTLETFEAALTRTASQMERVKERLEKAAEKEAQKKEELKKRRKMEKKAPKKSGPGGKQNAMDTTSSPQQQQQFEGQRKRPQRSKQGSNQESNQRKRPAAHVFFKDSDEEEEEKEAKKPKVSESDDEQTEVSANVTANKPLEPVKNVGVAPVVDMETEAAQEVETVGPKEERTVFISNLPADVTKEQLKERFSECGDVVDVRLVHSKRRSSRVNTFAYVEFKDSSPVKDALSLDRTKFMEKLMYVSPFRERGQKPPSSSNRQSNKSTVYVNNLQKDIQEHQLEELFKQCGEVREVRIVRNTAGRPKGYAYVEFTDESSAQEAVEKLNFHFLGLKKIGVAISNPPRRTADSASLEGEGARGVVEGVTTERDEEGFARPTFIPQRVAMQAEDIPMARRSRSNITLMPRVLAKKGGASDVKDPAKTSGGAKMSNDDFRKLFSK